MPVHTVYRFPATPCASGVTTLNHEVPNDAMELHPKVKHACRLDVHRAECVSTGCIAMHFLMGASCMAVVHGACTAMQSPTTQDTI